MKKQISLLFSLFVFAITNAMEQRKTKLNERGKKGVEAIVELNDLYKKQGTCSQSKEEELKALIKEIGAGVRALNQKSEPSTSKKSRNRRKAMRGREGSDWQKEIEEENKSKIITKEDKSGAAKAALSGIDTMKKMNVFEQRHPNLTDNIDAMLTSDFPNEINPTFNLEQNTANLNRQMNELTVIFNDMLSTESSTYKVNPDIDILKSKIDTLNEVFALLLEKNYYITTESSEYEMNPTLNLQEGIDILSLSSKIDTLKKILAPLLGNTITSD